jgi:hypothetical protein
MRIDYRTSSESSDSNLDIYPRVTFGAKQVTCGEAEAFATSHYYDPALGDTCPDGPRPLVAIYIAAGEGTLMLYLSPDDVRFLAELADEAEQEARSRAIRHRAAV